MQPGEEYTEVTDKVQSTILGKEEVKDISQLVIKDEDHAASFELPMLSSEAVADIFEDTSEIGVQMITYEFNPQSSPNNSNQISSKVVSLDLKDESGQTIQIADLPSDIVITIPFSHSNVNATPVSKHFLSPSIMQFHIVSVEQANTAIQFSIKICPQAPVTVYLRQGEKPSKDVFDEVVSLSDKNKTYNSDCQSENDLDFRNILLTATKRGNYYFGLLQSNKNKAIQSRNRRSLLPESTSKDRCVTFKDPPPTLPLPSEYVLVKPEYDPEKSVNYSLQMNTILCAYWSESKEMWTNEGCTVGQKSNNSTLECLCNHLTSFGGDFLVAPNSIDFDAVKRTLDSLDPGDMLVLATVCVVLLVYFLGLVAARRADKRDVAKNGPVISLNDSQNGDYEYEVSITTGGWRNSGTSANVSMILYGTEMTSDVINLTHRRTENRERFAQGNTDNFLICLPQPLGSLVKVQIGHDSSGKKTSWFLSEISVLDKQTGDNWLLACFRWLALDRDDGNTTKIFYVDNKGDTMSFKRKFNILQKTGFADDHLWCSIVCKQPRSSFTRGQRLSCCCCFLFMYMVTSAMFYGVESVHQQHIAIGPFSVTPSQLIIALQTALIIVPPSILITLLFRKSDSHKDLNGREDDYKKYSTKRRCILPYFCIYFAWFLCFSTAVASALFTVFYSLAWGGEKSARWLSSVTLSLTVDVLISQPVKIIVLSVIAASRCGRRKSFQESTQDSNVQPLFQMSSEEEKQAKDFKVKEKKMFKFIKELAFLLLFVLLLMIVCYGDKNEYRFQLADTTQKSFQKFDQLRNVTQFWHWMKERFVSGIFTGNWYNEQEDEVTEYIGDKQSILVGMPRLRQLRITKDSCDVPSLFRNMISFCHDSYSHDKEDKNNWQSVTGAFNRSLLSCQENWEYSTDEELGGFDTWGRFAVYNGGGYVANLGYNEHTASKVIDDLITNHWIDSQTRAVIVEFSLYNPSSNLLAVISYYYEVLPSGFSGTFKSYGIVPLTPTHSQAHSTYLFFVLLFGLFLVCCFIKECVKLFRQGCSYFNSVWNWLELFQIFSGSCALLLQWKKSKELAKTLAKLKENPFVTANFHQVLLMFEAETVFICITSATATLRVLRCFYFNAQVIKFTSFMRRYFASIVSFFVIFCVTFTGYAASGVIAFGSEYSTFSSFPKAFISQFLMVVGSTGLIDELEEERFIFGRLFLFCFMFTTVIVTANMFVAVLNFSYSNSGIDDLEQEELEISDFIVRQILLKVFGYTPQGKEDTDISKKLTNEVQSVVLSDAVGVQEENDSWRSNWSFSAANFTPVLDRSRKVSLFRQGAFDDDTAVVYDWATRKTDEKLSHTPFASAGINQESISRDSDTRGIVNLEHYYGGSAVLSPCFDIDLSPLKGTNGQRLITGCTFLANDDSDDDDDDDDDDDNDDDDEDYDDDDDYQEDSHANDVQCLDCHNTNKDPLEELLKCLDDGYWDDDFSTVGLAYYNNTAFVEDRK